MATTAFITGITGMVGSHLADHLLAHTDWNIVGMVRWRSPLTNIEHLLPRVNNGDRLRLAYADLNDEGSLFRVLGEHRPDYLFHLASQSFPATSFSSPVDTLTTNILGTCRLLEAVQLLGLAPKIHVCSSSEVFGRVKREQLPIAEDCSFHPASPYAISKVGTDLVGRLYAEAHGLNVQVTRMFTHTGPRRGDVFAESSFAKQIAMIEAKQIPPVVEVGNLDSLRTYLDVRDAVKAYHQLLTVNPIPGAYYNIGGNQVLTVRKVLDTLLELSVTKGIDVRVDPARVRPIDADLQVPDTTKFTAHTGWRPEIPFDVTMRDLLAYWRQRITRGEQWLRR